MILDYNRTKEALSNKRTQLHEYIAGLANQDNPSANHARIMASGRILQLDQNLALIDLLAEENK